MNASSETSTDVGGGWRPETPRFRPVRLVLSLVINAIAFFVAASIVPGVSIDSFGGALVVALVVAVLNAVLPPIVAALRLPFTLVAGFLLVLVVDALILLLADEITEGAITVGSFWDALLAALVVSAVQVVIEVVFGTNDDDVYTLRVVRRVARRQGAVH